MVAMDYGKQALIQHKKLKGKIKIATRDHLDSREKLSLYYTPGVGEVSRYVAEHPAETKDYTWTNNVVAVISDGSAVLGLGNIGPEGALPVMEGKAMIFKEFAGIDAVPIVLDVHDTDALVDTIAAMAPGFGGINLEDIAAPICFEVEERLKKRLSIPVMHDDQHGTAIVVLAALINAAKLTGKDLHSTRIVLVGAGAAGVAIARLLHEFAGPSITAVDSKGVLSRSRHDLNESKQRLLRYTNPDNISGTLADAMKGADIFIGVSGPDIVTADMVRSMAPDPIIFALANPTPEIMPDVATSAGAAIVATGRSDFANQINNALAFPGIFRGALDHRVRDITEAHKQNAAVAIASLVDQPDAAHIVPDVFDARLVSAIADVIV